MKHEENGGNEEYVTSATNTLMVQGWLECFLRFSGSLPSYLNCNEQIEGIKAKRQELLNFSYVGEWNLKHGGNEEEVTSATNTLMVQGWLECFIRFSASLPSYLNCNEQIEGIKAKRQELLNFSYVGEWNLKHEGNGGNEEEVTSATNTLMVQGWLECFIRFSASLPLCLNGDHKIE